MIPKISGTFEDHKNTPIRIPGLGFLQGGLAACCAVTFTNPVSFGPYYRDWSLIVQ